MVSLWSIDFWKYIILYNLSWNYIVYDFVGVEVKII